LFSVGFGESQFKSQGCFSVDLPVKRAFVCVAQSMTLAGVGSDCLMIMHIF